MAYDLAIQCSHRVGVLSVYPEMSSKKIMELIGLYFDITIDSFELEVYDDRFGRYIDFDDEYAEELRQILPRTIKKTLNARVLFQEIEKTETISSFNDAPSPSYVPSNSPSSMSASEDLRSTTPNINLNLCFNDNSSPSPSNLHLDSDSDFNPIFHLTFVRDVASHQRSQYQLNDYHQNARYPYVKKKNYIIRIQGVKRDSDKKYTSILPEIKFPLHLLRQDRLTLVVAVVIEERNEEQVSWRLDTRKGFLRDDVETDTVHYNPLCLSIDRSELTSDGIFKLPLRMCTIPLHQIGKVGSIFYTLSQNSAQKLHTADYEPNTSRLACVLADQNNTIQWDTFGISDFMRPKIYTKRKVEELNSTTQCCEGASNLPSKHIRSTKEFKIALIGSNRAEMNDSISEVHQTHNPVPIFDKTDSLIEFLACIRHQVALIIFNCLDETLISSIHGFPQLHSIYILSLHNDNNAEWTNKWNKIVGIFNDIRTICHALKQIILENESNRIRMNITAGSSNTDLNVNSKSIIYQQCLRETWSQIQYNENIKKDFVDYCRGRFVDQDASSIVLKEFNQEHDCSSPIWWYTRESFMYSVLNRALRQRDSGTLKMCSLMRDIHNRYNRLQFVTMCNINNQIDEDTVKLSAGFSDRFFQKVKQNQHTPKKLTIEADSINNLYQKIEQLHLKTDETIQTTVYRGQAISYSELEKLKQNQHSLLSLNNFLSTSIDRNVACMFAESAQSQPDLIGIIFQITIDTSVLSKPFALINNTSYFNNSEDEVLFSMQSLFRIRSMKCLDDRLWQVNLTLPHVFNKKSRCQLREFRQKITNASTRLRNLGVLMINMGEFEKAEEFFKKLSETELQDSWEERGYLYYQLGCIKDSKNDFDSALAYYQKSLEIRNKKLSLYRLELARLFNNIGMVYKSMGNESKKILYLQEALHIHQTSLKLIPSDAVMIYNNIGQLYRSREEYATSLSYFQKAIEIHQNFHVSPHPFLSSIYFNLSQLYYSMGNSVTALNFFRKALEIHQQKPSFIPTEQANSHNVIGTVHDATRKYMSALVDYQEVLRMRETYLSFEHIGKANKARLILKQTAKNTDIKDLSKAPIRSKTNSEHFVGSMTEVEWLNTNKNTYKISYKSRERMTWCLFSIIVRELLDAIETGNTDEIKFFSETCKDEIQDHLKLVVELKQPRGLIRTHISMGKRPPTKSIYDLAEIDSNFRLLSTQDLFYLDYSNNEAPQDLDKHIVSQSFISHYSLEPYNYTGIAYRGMNIEPDELIIYKKGNTVSAHSFVSTSQHENVVKCFLSINDVRKKPVMCVFKVKDARSTFCTKNLDKFSMEKEVLSAPFIVFRVLKADKMDMDVGDNNDPIRVISLEECDLNLS